MTATARHRAAVEDEALGLEPHEDAAPAVVEVEDPPRCNVPRCKTAPEHRGLCPAHRQTHRGLLDPAEKGRA